MATKTGKSSEMKLKHYSKGMRTHMRRLKQEARKMTVTIPAHT
jgi:ribosomal protein S21